MSEEYVVPTTFRPFINVIATGYNRDGTFSFEPTREKYLSKKSYETATKARDAKVQFAKALREERLQAIEETNRV